LSLSLPERVRFRYRLDGYDGAWSEPVAAREAAYTNLGPGPYRFRVTASNPDGIWSGNESSVAFQIDPAYWQTLWFQGAILALAFLIFLALYRLRLQRLTAGLNMRFEERLAERNRIAQELHDTLLQGFLSASMQVYVAADRLDAHSEAKQSLLKAMELMTKVTEEGRNAVRGLRSTDDASFDLVEAFSQIRDELGPEESGDAAQFRVVVEGERRPLQPALRDEVYRIGREALLNAFRHAKAKEIEIELNYTPSRFKVSVRDDGCGIDPATLRNDNAGHWGLSGMRERADRMGARIKMWSGVDGGTEIELSVPAAIAFQNNPNTLVKWLNREYLRVKTRIK
jgi:signal transduction histidine kinase